jgi:hypothetical protein
MSLLSRNLRSAAWIVFLFVLSILPLSGPTPHRVDIFPATAWAGGSPDETLNPQPPPQRARAYTIGTDIETASDANNAAYVRSTRPASGSALSWKVRIAVALHVLRGIYLSSMLRF